MFEGDLFMLGVMYHSVCYLHNKNDHRYLGLLMGHNVSCEHTAGDIRLMTIVQQILVRI